MSIDERIDHRLAALHGNALLDPLMYAASWFGDDGRGWIAAAALRSRRSPQPLVAFGRQMAWLGIESVVVNGPAKGLTRRPRPVSARVHHRRVRRPSNSSFPSGHAASAATMATLLSEDGLAPLWWTIALTVSASRMYLGMHHTSDVMAGLAIGTLIGLAARGIDLPGLARSQTPVIGGPDVVS